MLSDEEIFFMYGKSVVISRKDRFTLVHLDRPSAELVRVRTENFEPEEFFHSDCPICRLAKEGGLVVFDDAGYEEEQILLE